MTALLSPDRRIIWVTWLVAALLFLAVGNGLVYCLIIPLSAGLLVLLAPGCCRALAGTLMAGTFVRFFCCTSLVVTALYLAFRVFTVDRTLWLFLC